MSATLFVLYTIRPCAGRQCVVPTPQRLLSSAKVSLSFNVFRADIITIPRACERLADPIKTNPQQHNKNIISYT